MEYEEKIKLCEKYFAEDYEIDEHTAHKIIRDMEIQDTVIQMYAEELQEAEEERQEEWEQEKKMNWDLYFGDIHR